MLLLGLQVKQELIDLAVERESAGRQAKGAGPRLRVVSDYVVQITRTRYPSCKCEDHGLFAGMTFDSMMRLTGCRDGWVCPRLDSLRREMGH
jgi:hypothetical protein